MAGGGFQAEFINECANNLGIATPAGAPRRVLRIGFFRAVNVKVVVFHRLVSPSGTPCGIKDKNLKTSGGFAP